MYLIEFPFNKVVRLDATATAYYRIKNSTTDTFLEVLKKENMFSSFDIFLKKNFSKAIPFL